MEKECVSHIGGHITLFFTVEKEGRLLRNQGSRGVGINIQHGVKVKLSTKKTPLTSRTLQSQSMI